MTDRTPAQTAMLAHLDELNDAVDKAVAARKQWMDDNMAAFAEFKVGDVVYDRTTGAWVGQISKLYRVHQDDPRFDRSMSVDYQFETSPRCFDNTNRQYRRLTTAQQILDNNDYRVNERELWEHRAAHPETVTSRDAWIRDLTGMTIDEDGRIRRRRRTPT